MGRKKRKTSDPTPHTPSVVSRNPVPSASSGAGSQTHIGLRALLEQKTDTSSVTQVKHCASNLFNSAQSSSQKLHSDLVKHMTCPPVRSNTERQGQPPQSDPPIVPKLQQSVTTLCKASTLHQDLLPSNRKEGSVGAGTEPSDTRQSSHPTVAVTSSVPSGSDTHAQIRHLLLQPADTGLTPSGSDGQLHSRETELRQSVQGFTLRSPFVLQKKSEELTDYATATVEVGANLEKFYRDNSQQRKLAPSGPLLVGSLRHSRVDENKLRDPVIGKEANLDRTPKQGRLSPLVVPTGNLINQQLSLEDQIRQGISNSREDQIRQGRLVVGEKSSLAVPREGRVGGKLHSELCDTADIPAQQDVKSKVTY